jgi:hypothetical protein
MKPPGGLDDASGGSLLRANQRPEDLAIVPPWPLRRTRTQWVARRLLYSNRCPFNFSAPGQLGGVEKTRHSITLSSGSELLIQPNGHLVPSSSDYLITLRWHFIASPQHPGPSRTQLMGRGCCQTCLRQPSVFASASSSAESQCLEDLSPCSTILLTRLKRAVVA